MLLESQCTKYDVKRCIIGATDEQTAHIGSRYRSLVDSLLAAARKARLPASTGANATASFFWRREETKSRVAGSVEPQNHP